MANVNAGVPVRFENNGVILIGANTLLNIKEGTLEWSVPGYEPITHMDRGVLVSVLAGNERPVKGKLDVKYTSLVDTDGVLTALMGTLATNKIKNRLSTGLLFTFGMTVKLYDTPDGITYDQLVFANCFLPDGLSYKAGSGTDHDTLSISFTDLELSPTITKV
jgi:hypothetical protein